MGFEKTIEHKKEHRKPYNDSRAIVYSCRNHGSCGRCKGNRLYQSNRENERTETELKEHYSGM